MKSKIAIFLSSFGDGGAHKNMINISGWLCNNGYDVDLVVVKDDGPLQSLVPNDVNIHVINSSRVRYSLFGLRTYIRENDPDALLATPTGCSLIAGFSDILMRTDVSVTLRIPAILSNERFYTNPKDPLEKISSTIIRFIYSRSDSIIAISKGVKSDLVQEFGIKRDKIKVIYNPAVTDDIFNKKEQEVDHPFFTSANTVFISVGRLVKEKGYEYLIRAFNEYKSSENDKLIILGKGHLKSNLTSLCDELSLSDSVSFPGFVNNPYKYINKSDVFVSSSLSEGFGNVIVEALACETPVIATDCDGGPKEILSNGKYGELVPPRDVNQLAIKMGEVSDKDIDTKKLKNRSLDFHVKKIAPKYEKYLMNY